MSQENWFYIEKEQNYLKRERKNIVIALFLLFLSSVTITLAGYGWFLEYKTAIDNSFSITLLFKDLISLKFIILGSYYSFPLIVVLLAHEFGHFFMCRKHNLYSTPPFLIPFPSVPIFFQTFGTLGAFIKIKEPFRNRKELFDVGAGGPLSGFIFLLPAVFLGIFASYPVLNLTLKSGDIVLGEPLIFKLGEKIFFPGAKDIILHPIGWAAYIGCVATSLNLLPIGQLDGGHIVYSLFGRKIHKAVSLISFFGLILLSLLSWPTPSYLLFAIIVFFLGLEHPPLYFESIKPDFKRYLLGVVSLLVFILTFIPIPITIMK